MGELPKKSKQEKTSESTAGLPPLSKDEVTQRDVNQNVTNPTDENTTEESEQAPKKTIVGRLRDKILGRRQAIEDKIFKYGPPYYEDYGGDLSLECQNPNMSWIDIHQLLLDGADPRIQDKEDIGNTPMHLACRYCRLDIAKILVRAGADINPKNQYGITPFTMACMFNQPEPKRKAHTKLLDWLLDQGADIHNSDRGGHTAIELAAAKGNMDAVTLLLARGAKIYRPTKYLTFEMPSALDAAKDSDFRVERILYKSNELEMKTFERKKRQLWLKAEERAAEERAKNRRAEMEQARAAAKEKELQIRADAKRRKERRQKRLREHKAKVLAEKTKMEANFGVWEKKGVKQWELNTEISRKNAHAANILDASTQMYENNSTVQQRKLNRRWKKITGHRLKPPSSAVEFETIREDRHLPLLGKVTR